jgi:hypothetical protein
MGKIFRGDKGTIWMERCKKLAEIERSTKKDLKKKARTNDTMEDRYQEEEERKIKDRK